jgi:hypothetical protein
MEHPILSYIILSYLIIIKNRGGVKVGLMMGGSVVHYQGFEIAENIRTS